MPLDLASGSALLLVLVVAALVPARSAAVVFVAATVLLALAQIGHLPTTGWDSATWEPLGIVLGLSVLIAAMLRAGQAPRLAVIALRASRGEPWRLLLLLCGLEIVLSIVGGNVFAIAVVGAITAVVSKQLGLDVVPFLAAEAVCGQLCGILTLTGSVPTAIVASVAGFSYLRVAIVCGPYAILGFAVSLALVRLRYGWVFSPLAARAAEIAQQRISRFDPALVGGENMHFRRLWTVCGLVLILLVLQDAIPLLRDVKPGLIVLCGAAALLLVLEQDPSKVLARVDWSLVIYLVAVGWLLGLCRDTGLHNRVAVWVQSYTAHHNVGSTVAILLLSSLAGSLLGNVQSSLVLSSLLGPCIAPVSSSGFDSLWWALILGSGLGGLFPPLGGGVILITLGLLRVEGQPTAVVRFALQMLLFWVVLTISAALYLLLLPLLRTWPVVGLAISCWLALFVVLARWVMTIRNARIPD